MRNPYVLSDSGIEMTDCLSVIDKMSLVTLKFINNTRSNVGQSQRRFEHNLTGNLRKETPANS